jgi:hypothetical protein
MKKGTSKASRSILTNQPKDHLGFLEPTARVKKGQSWTPKGGLVDEKIQFTTGAQRSATTASEEIVDYTLVCPAALRRLAATMAEGAEKYGKHNWTKGIPNSNSLNHALDHLNAYLAGDRKEDHLGHALANIQFIIHFNHNCPCQEGFKLLESTNKEV